MFWRGEATSAAGAPFTTSGLLFDNGLNAENQTTTKINPANKVRKKAILFLCDSGLLRSLSKTSKKDFILCFELQNSSEGTCFWKPSRQAG